MIWFAWSLHFFGIMSLHKWVVLRELRVLFRQRSYRASGSVREKVDAHTVSQTQLVFKSIESHMKINENFSKSY
jgi:hypothetical protein